MTLMIPVAPLYQRQGEGNDEMVHPLDELNEEGELS
jgi:hypothetical protein